MSQLPNSACDCGHEIGVVIGPKGKGFGHLVNILYRAEGVPGWWMELRCQMKDCNCLRSVRVTPS